MVFRIDQVSAVQQVSVIQETTKFKVSAVQQVSAIQEMTKFNHLHKSLAVIAPTVPTHQNMKMLNQVQHLLHVMYLFVVHSRSAFHFSYFNHCATCLSAYSKQDSKRQIIIRQVPDTTLSLRCGDMMID